MLLRAMIFWQGHLSVVEILLDYNASIHLRDLVERTPLHWAAIGGHGDVCDFLIQKGKPTMAVT